MCPKLQDHESKCRTSPFRVVGTYSSNWSDWHCVCFVKSVGKLSIVVLGRRKESEGVKIA
jgi:hypothetical protein